MIKPITNHYSYFFQTDEMLEDLKISVASSSVDVDAKSKDDHNNTPLHYAAFKGDVEFVKFLLNMGANVKATNTGHYTPLHAAIHYGVSTKRNSKYIEVIEMLLDAGADVNCKDIDGNTPLLEALQHKHLDNADKVISLLIDRGAEINESDNNGYTALHYAFSDIMHPEMAEILLLKGANVNALNNDGFSPLNEALKSDNRDAVALLIKHGADKNLIDGCFKSKLDQILAEEQNPQIATTKTSKKAQHKPSDKNNVKELESAIKGGEFSKALEIIENSSMEIIKKTGSKEVKKIARDYEKSDKDLYRKQKLTMYQIFRNYEKFAKESDFKFESARKAAFLERNTIGYFSPKDVEKIYDIAEKFLQYKKSNPDQAKALLDKIVDACVETFKSLKNTLQGKSINNEIRKLKDSVDKDVQDTLKTGLKGSNLLETEQGNLSKELTFKAKSKRSETVKETIQNKLEAKRNNESKSKTNNR